MGDLILASLVKFSKSGWTTHAFGAWSLCAELSTATLWDYLTLSNGLTVLIVIIILVGAAWGANYLDEHVTMLENLDNIGPNPVQVKSAVSCECKALIVLPIDTAYYPHNKCTALIVI
jgi:hypothetical protein